MVMPLCLYIIITGTFTILSNERNCFLYIYLDSEDKNRKYMGLQTKMTNICQSSKNLTKNKT